MRVIGEGPVVQIEEKQIDYGAIPVLTDSSYELQLANESLIPADFYCEMVKYNMKQSPRGILDCSRKLCEISRKISEGVSMKFCLKS